MAHDPFRPFETNLDQDSALAMVQTPLLAPMMANCSSNAADPRFYRLTMAG
jgi:hypothetical protein